MSAPGGGDGRLDRGASAPGAGVLEPGERTAPSGPTSPRDAAPEETLVLLPAAPGVPVDLAPAVALLQTARRLLLTCHLSPDGDSTGSMSALASLLRAQGRDVALYNPDGVPRNLKWLPHAGDVARGLPAGHFDLTIVVDCGDRKLLGPSFPGRDRTGPLLVIDHHAAARPFGDIYLSDPAAAAVGVLVARLADSLGWPIEKDAATGIYVSLVADTGSFRYSNANAEAFQLAARLVSSCGVEPWAINRALGEEVPLPRYRLLALALQAIELELGGRVAVMVVTDDMLKQSGARWEHSEGLVSYARAIEGVECGVFISPARDGGTRISLRSKGRTIDAGAVCTPHGGGGHRGAAGCTLPLALADARKLILADLAAALDSAAADAPEPAPPAPPAET